MRNELDKIRLIEQYLRQELSPEELSAFETQLKNNTALQQEVEKQRELVEGINRVGAKQSIQKATKKYQIKKLTYKIGLIGLVIVASIAAFSAYHNNSILEQHLLPRLNEKGEELWAEADQHLPAQYFQVKLSNDTLISTEGGMVLHIPQNAFLDENGAILTGEVELEIKEALEVDQIIKAGLESKSGERLLESAGMFYINARQGERSVQINPEAGIYTEIPADEINANMQLFEGVRKTDGSIDWVNPSPLENFLTPVDINSLNFYPPQYEPELQKMGYGGRGKSYKDSLYYSFAWVDESNCFHLYDTEKEQYPIGEENQYHPRRDRIDWDQFITRNDCGDFELNLILLGRKQNSPSIKNLMDYTLKYPNYIPESSDIRLGKIYLNNAWEAVDFNPNNLPNGELRAATQQYNSNVHIKQKIKVLKEGITSIGFEVPTEEDPTISDTLLLGMWFTKNDAHMEEEYENSLLGSLTESKDSLADSLAMINKGVNPAKIKTIWNDAFANTLLATKEFEERLKSIFLTCNDEVLDIYVNNLDRNLYELDSMAAEQCSGELKLTFKNFAQRKEGKVQVDQKRLKRLQKHYKQEQEIFAKAIQETQQTLLKQQQQLDQAAVEKRTAHQDKNRERLHDNFTKELKMNLDNAYQQLGKPKPRRVTSPNRYRATIRSNGWKNVDVYVAESLINRETLDYKDPKTGKKAVIKYNKVSLRIDQNQQYDRILAYLLPDQLNSFMRMKKDREGIFNEKLNELMKYNLVVLAYKGEKAFYFSQNNIEAKQYDAISLAPISKGELTKVFAQYGNKKKEELREEFNYLLFQQKENKRQKEIQEVNAFRYQIECAIFPCSERSGTEKETTIVDEQSFASE